jgi:putative methyltransferase (TIGR04325 family)
LLKQLVRKFRGPPRRGDFEFVPEGWDRARDNGSVKGWNVASVVETQTARWEAARDRLSTPQPLASDVTTHNTLVSFAYVAALAAHSANRLSLLDWGGGLGQYGGIAAAVLPGVEIDYYCKDVPVQCEAGRRFSPRTTFFEHDDEFAGRKFDLVLASGALQYVEDWQGVLARLVSVAGRYLFVTRLPVVEGGESFVVLQRAQAYGYDTEYLGWCLSRDEFLAAASGQGIELVREFCLEPVCRVPDCPASWQSRGYLFRAA